MRADRLLSLLMLLQVRGRMSARQLAEELEVCERTIYRDILALSAAGIPVYGEAGPAGGFQLVDSYRTTLTGLSEEETRALFVVNMPGTLAGLGLDQPLKAAMLKLAASLPAPRRQDEERVRQRYCIDPDWSHPASEAQPILQVIQQALWQDRQLEITYSPVFDVQIQRRVAPYGLASRSGTWYLVFSHNGRVRVRHVDDLLEIRLRGEKFVRPPDFDLPSFWKRWCDLDRLRSGQYPVTLRISNRALPAVLRRFAVEAHGQGTAPQPDGSTLLTLNFRWIGEARERLLPLGSGVEVLSPFALRASLADAAEQTAALYRQTADIKTTHQE